MSQPPDRPNNRNATPASAANPLHALGMLPRGQNRTPAISVAMSC